jgi:PhnB protein
MVTINPYLSFNGYCEEAFNLYKSVFGGEFSHVERYKDMPSEKPIPETEKQKILHIALPISKEVILMGSDTSEVMGQISKRGNNFSLSVSTESEEETARIFNALAKDGTITMKLGKTFWGAFYGMLIDKFGIQWMVSYELGQKG